MTLVISACTADPPEERLLDYETRLFRTLEITAQEKPTTQYMRFPSQPTLLADNIRETIDILDLWSIRECALHGVLAPKNSALGRVAQPSTRMFYALEFLRLAPQCIQQLQSEGKEDLAAILSEAIASKEAQLPKIIWQGVLGGGEYERYWKIPQQLGDYPEAENYGSDTALAALADDVERWLDKDYRYQSSEVEGNLQKILAGDGGALYKSIVLQGFYLVRIDTALKERLQTGRVCRSGKDARANILDTVVRKYVVGTIQPWSVQIQARAFQLDAAREIEDLLAAGQPETFGVWKEKRDRVITEALQAPRNHVQSLLPIMRQCGLAPEDQAL